MSTPETAKSWKERDGLVKMWLYGTIANSLVETILKSKATSHQLWMSIESLFRDNKENRALQLENDLRTITIGDLSIQEYCRKLKNLSDLLANVDSPVSDRTLVMHCLNGLTEKFDGIHNVIRHRVPFPSFTTARSMLLDEESRLNKMTRPTASHTQTASSPSVLLVSDPSASASQSSHSGGGNSGYNNSDGNYGISSKRGGRGGGRNNRGRGRNNHFGSNNNYGGHSYGYHTTGNFAQPPPWSYGLHPMTAPFYPNSYSTIPQYGPQNLSPLVSHGPQAQQQFNYGPTHQQRGQSILGPYSHRPQQQEAHFAHALATQLNDGTLTLQDPADVSWYMDSGVTNHITSQPAWCLEAV